MRLRDLDRRTVVAVIGALALAGAIAGIAIVSLGLYNVSARKEHWPGVGWALHTTFENAVACGLRTRPRRPRIWMAPAWWRWVRGTMTPPARSATARRGCRAPTGSGAAC